MHGRIVLVAQGTYTYRDDVLTFTYRGQEPETAQVVWLGEKQFSCTANDTTTIYTPAGGAPIRPPVVPNWQPQPWTPPVIPPVNMNWPYGGW